MSGYLRIFWLDIFFRIWSQSYPKSQKISFHILLYPSISFHILTYPKISSGANSQMIGKIMCIIVQECSLRQLSVLYVCLPVNADKQAFKFFMDTVWVKSFLHAWVKNCCLPFAIFQPPPCHKQDASTLSKMKIIGKILVMKNNVS